MIKNAKAKRKMTFLRRFKKDQEGAAAVEFALISIPFFGILFTLIETGLGFFTGQLLETTAADAGRLVMTGQIAAGNPTAQGKADAFKKKVCDDLKWYLDCGNPDFKMEMVSYKSAGDMDNALPIENGAFQPDKLKGLNNPNPGEYVRVRIYYSMPVYGNIFGLTYSGTTADRKQLLIGTSVFKTEPWGSTN